MTNAFVCRIAPRTVKDGQPRGTLVDPAIVASGGNLLQDFRPYYDKTIGHNLFPSQLILEFGQPPQDNGTLALSKGDLVIYLVGSDDVDGGSNERGIYGIGRITQLSLQGAGVKARCVLHATTLVQLSKILSNDGIKKSPFLTDSGIMDIGVFGLHGAPQAHNCVRFYVKDDIATKRSERLVGLLGMLDRFDSSFKSQLAASDPTLAALIPPSPVVAPAKSDLVGFVDTYSEQAKTANLILAKGLIPRFCAALLAKRFLILTGLSGSGKTKLAHAFAAWLSESEDQYRLVAVGADWTTNENVVGYQDALQAGIYRKPSNGALDVILRAENDQMRPYFLILDEMNLSHVERYFADILSAIESGEKIALHSSAENLNASEDDPLSVPPKLRLPENLFIIGTVNVDETTYMFSPKVLDRANVIEFRATADDITAFLEAPSKVDMEALATKGAAFGSAFVAEAKTDAQLEVATAADLKARLTEIFGALAPIGAEFGFRTAYEITRFTYFYAKLTGEGWQFKDALDAQVLQKLLPKLHGSERRLGPVLKTLEAFCTTHECDDSLKKIRRMQDRLKDGFTSFAEA